MSEDRPDYGFYCTEHYKCYSCGTTDGLCRHTDRLMCRECNEEEMVRRVAAFEGDTDYTTEVICPHCGYEYRDSWELEEGTTECQNCGNSFEIDRYVEVTYCTTKVVPR